jgi:hypothetical protein
MLDRLRAHAHHLALALVLVVMAGLMLRGSSQDSPTEDELTHMVRGIAYWQSRDTRLSYGHPALGNAWTALPVAFDRDNPRIDTLDGWKTATAAKVTKAYLEQGYGYARAQLMRARWAAMALGLLLVTYVFYWSRSIFGPRTALAVLLLTAFNPVVMAQCRYVTTDPPAMLGYAIAVGELVRYLRGAKYSVLLMPLGLSLGLLTKYSGVTLVPFTLVVGATVCGLALGRFAGMPRKERWLALAKHAGVAVLVTTFAINLVYKFNDTGMTVGAILDKPEPVYWVSSRYDDLLESFTPLPKLPRSRTRPACCCYWRPARCCWREDADCRCRARSSRRRPQPSCWWRRARIWRWGCGTCCRSSRFFAFYPDEPGICYGSFGPKPGLASASVRCSAARFCPASRLVPTTSATSTSSPVGARAVTRSASTAKTGGKTAKGSPRW